MNMVNKVKILPGFMMLNTPKLQQNSFVPDVQNVHQSGGTIVSTLSSAGKVEPPSTIYKT
jgi:hypothetical protein